jgi:uncharacterized C2H2 Zn-finger protein
MARARNTDAAATSGEFTCPECGKTFARAASLGAHRSRAHGVAGAAAAKRSRPKRAISSAKPRTPSGAATTKRGGATASTGAASKPASTRRRAASRRRSTSVTDSRGRSQTKVDRDALLQALFPAGIPARESVLAQLNGWLAEAERLAKLA